METTIRGTPSVPPALSKDWVLVKEAAVLLGVHWQTVHRMLADGRLQRRQLPHAGRVLVSRASINKLLRSR